MVRSIDVADTAFLHAMLYEAIYTPPGVARPPLEVMDDPQIAHYIAGWGRLGDEGLVAVEIGVLVGAAWFRLFATGDPGYGFVSAETPELAMAVEARHRGQGIGSELLLGLIEVARRRGYPGLSLSVDPENPAKRLYRRAGFLDWAGSGRTMFLAL